MATTTGIGVSQTLAIDLAKPGIPKVVYAMQGEGYTRTVSLRISNDGVDWTPPSDAAYQVSYRKPDGKGGTYSSYTTDSSKPAVEVSGGRLNVVLIPQMLQVAGRVRVEVHMQRAAIMEYAARLSTFTFYIMVQASAESGITSTDYWEAARNDKVVLLTQAVLPTAGTETAYNNLDVFISTPHKGDTVVGTNGYTATVTKVEGTTVALRSTGKRWGVPATSVYSQDVAYNGSVDGTNVENVKAALDRLSARQGVLTVNATYNSTSGAVSADCNYEQISAAVAQKNAVICIMTPTLGTKAVLPLSSLGNSTAIFRAPAINDGAVGIRTLALDKDTGTWTVSADWSGTTAAELMVVQFTKQSGGTITADKTISEISAAHSSGKPVIGVYANSDYQLMTADPSGPHFALWTGVETLVLKGVTNAGADTWTLEHLPIKGTKVVLKGQIDGVEFGDVAGALALLAARGAKIEITLENGASPSITSVTKDGVSVGSTVAEWANAVHEAVQKGCPITFVIGTSHYCPTNVNWDSSGTRLEYLVFSLPSDLTLYYYVRVSLPLDGVPSVIIDDQM